MTDLRQTQNYADFLKRQGWIVKRMDNTNYFIKKLPIIGSVMKIQRPKKINHLTIKQLTDRYRAFQIIVEPKDKHQESSIRYHGYKLSKSPYLPSKTIHIDLTEPLKFNKETRRAIRKGSAFTVKEYSSPKDIEVFYTAWKKSVNFTRYVPSLQTLKNLKNSFPNNTSIFLASHNISGSIIGGAIFTISSHGNKNIGVYYMHGFTNNEGRISLSQYSLLHQGILWGKRMGCKIFDFEGIYDERFPNKSWLGFTHFKKQFGGSEVLYPGCYIQFRIYNLFKFLK